MVKISTPVIGNDARACDAVVEDEAALEFHWGGALTFRGLESTGIIDRPPHSTNDRASHSVRYGYNDQ